MFSFKVNLLIQVVWFEVAQVVIAWYVVASLVAGHHSLWFLFVFFGEMIYTMGAIALADDMRPNWCETRLANLVEIGEI